jgi:hypothetical protein
MDARLDGAFTVRWILVIFGIEDFIHHRAVPGEYKHSISNNRSPSNDQHET